METIKTLRGALLFLVSLGGLLLFSLFAPCGGLLSPALAASGESVGYVSRVQGTAFAVQGDELRPMEQNALVRRTDVLRTGPDARLEITLLDETRLTLSADSEFSVERYDLGRQPGAGAVLLRLTKGAFRVATGRLENLRGGPFEVATPLATIGIRGTDFWGGYLSVEELSVLLISGKGVTIKNDAGTSEIVRPYEGVVVRSATTPPPEPSLWSPDRRARALKTVTFN